MPLLTSKDVSLVVRGKLYRGCVHRCVLHGSETWPKKKENEVALQQAEMKLNRWMYVIQIADRFMCSELGGVRPTKKIWSDVMEKRLSDPITVQGVCYGPYSQSCTMQDCNF